MNDLIVKESELPVEVKRLQNQERKEK